MNDQPRLQLENGGRLSEETSGQAKIGGKKMRQGDMRHSSRAD